jgi:hypothetical protein
MAKANLAGRRYFKTSGKVNWVRFIPWTAIVLVVAVLLACLLAFLFLVGFYLVVIVPILAGLGIAGLMLLAVRQGHCRSRLVGGLLGAFAGIVVFLGHYYVGMIHDMGWEFAAHPEVFPDYLKFRIKYTVVKDVGAPDKEERDKKQPRPADVYFNWGSFAFEFGIILFFAAGVPIRWAGRPYCEACQSWMKREATTFKPEIGPGIVEALRQSSVQSLAALFTSPPKPGAPNTTVAVDYCQKMLEGGPTNCPVCLSIKQVTKAGRGVGKNAFDQSLGKTIVSQVLVNPDEVAALLPRFTSLEKVAGTTAAQALKELQVEVKPIAPPGAVAEIKPADPEYAGKVLTTKTGLICTAYGLLALLGVFGPIGLGFLGGMLAFPDHPAAGGVSPLVKLSGEFLIGLAVLIFVLNFAMLFIAPDFLATRYIRRLTVQHLKRRPRPLVSPDDPAALFVQVIPRANWAKLKLLDPTDIGFLRADMQRRELLFEGDKECYRIPADAIVSCDIELFVAGDGTHGATRLYRVVLQLNQTSGNLLEIPFAQRGNSGKLRTKVRLKWAQELERQINDLRAPAA